MENDSIKLVNKNKTSIRLHSFKKMLLYFAPLAVQMHIGAGAIELAGHVPPKFLTAGARDAQQNSWGTCKKIKKD